MKAGTLSLDGRRYRYDELHKLKSNTTQKLLIRETHLAPLYGPRNAGIRLVI